MLNKSSGGRWSRLVTINFSLVLAAVLLLLVTQSLRANEEVAPQVVWDAAQANLEGSSKSVSHTEALAGTILSYQIIISNSGATGAPDAMMTDTLPASLTYQPGSLEVVGGGLAWGYADNVVTWTGSIATDNSVTISFAALVSDSLMGGDIITNTAEISGAGELLLRWATTTIITSTEPATTTIFLPYITKPLPIVNLHPVSRPNSNNEWLVSWTAVGGGITGYQLQESQTANFAVITNQVNVGSTTTAVQVNHPATFNNKYYYRIRAVSGDMVGPWSNIQSVVGAYYDDFTNNTSGWDLRRTTYLEQTVLWYGTGNEQDNLVVIVADRFDWMIVSPLREAPAVPYVIEYRKKVHDPAHRVSGGVVVGGDWNGQPCYDPSSYGGIYYHTNCFNQFYNLNFILSGPINLLYERVDGLEWCPTCMGSPMKRLGLTEHYAAVQPETALDWHTYRVEVHEEGIRVFVDGNLIAQPPYTPYHHQPYFGIFGSTWNYEPSIWLYDWFRVTPLD